MVATGDVNLSANLSFETAIAELDEIVKKLEQGSLTIEESINLYSRGNVLRSFCESKLKEAKMKVEQVVLSQDGTIALTEAKNG